MSSSGESNNFIIFLFVGVSIIIGISIFGAKVSELMSPGTGGGILKFGLDYLSWAWYIGLAAGIVCFKAAIFLCVGIMGTANGPQYR